MLKVSWMVNSELKGHIGSAPIYPSSSVKKKERKKRCISRIKRIVPVPSNFAVMAA